MGGGAGGGGGGVSQEKWVYGGSAVSVVNPYLNTSVLRYFSLTEVSVKVTCDDSVRMAKVTLCQCLVNYLIIIMDYLWRPIS